VLLVPLVSASVGPRTAVITVGPDSPLAAPDGVARFSFERDANHWDFLLLRTGERAFTALSAVCTHQGCLVVMMTTQRVFVCPCHGSRYDRTGAVVRGPAVEPLRSVPAHFADGALTVTFQV